MSLAARVSVAVYLEREHPRHTELLDGVVVVNKPTLRHQRLCGEIYMTLRDWERTVEGSGTTTLPLDLVLGDDVLAPDVMWFAQPLPDDSRRAPRTPELVVEVRSRSTWAHDIGRKRMLYEAHGVLELWLVDTEANSVLRFARSTAGASWFDLEEELGRDQTLGSALLEGFALSLADLFDRPSPHQA